MSVEVFLPIYLQQDGHSFETANNRRRGSKRQLFSALFFLAFDTVFQKEEVMVSGFREHLFPHSCIRLMPRSSYHSGTFLRNHGGLREFHLSEGFSQTLHGLATGPSELGSFFSLLGKPAIIKL